MNEDRDKASGLRHCVACGGLTRGRRRTCWPTSWTESRSSDAWWCFDPRGAEPRPRRVSDLQNRIKGLSEGEYAAAKQDVDRLRKELGQPPLPPLQATIEEKSAE